MAETWVTNAAIGREFTRGAQMSKHSAAQIMAGANATAMCAFALADISHLMVCMLAALEKLDTNRATDTLTQQCRWNDIVESIRKATPPQQIAIERQLEVPEMSQIPVGVMSMVKDWRIKINDLIDFNRVPEHLTRTLKKIGVYRRHQITEELGNSLKPLAKRQFFNTFNPFPEQAKP